MMMMKLVPCNRRDVLSSENMEMLIGHGMLRGWWHCGMNGINLVLRIVHQVARSYRANHYGDFQLRLSCLGLRVETQIIRFGGYRRQG